MNSPVHGLILVDDLIFFSRVAVTARAQGLMVRQSRSVAMLLEDTEKLLPRAIIVDLQFPSLAISDLLQDLRARIQPPPRLIGYGSHVDFETLKAARKAGCDRVMPRSQFVEELDSKLPEWLRLDDRRVNESEFPLNAIE